MCWLLGPEPEPEAQVLNQHQTPSIDDIIYGEEFLASGFNTDLFASKVQVAKDAIDFVAEHTTGQRDNPLWHRCVLIKH